MMERINLSIYAIAKSDKYLRMDLGVDEKKNTIIIVSPAPNAGFFMIKLMKIMGVMGILGVMSISPSLALDRNAYVAGARAVSVSNFNYNINRVNISLNSGPTFVGSNNHSLPAYQSIAQTIAQIEALKLQLKNFPAK